MKLTERIKSTLQLTTILMVVLQFWACSKGTENGEGPDDDEPTNEIQIQVGSRTITTNKYTADGTPVVPMWNAPMPTDDRANGAGFEVLQDAEHAWVWQPEFRDEGAYNHYACLVHHKGKFYAMWANHEFGEDGPGQRVLYSVSESWDNWTDPEELFVPPGPVRHQSENGIHLKADRWAVLDDELYAITYVHGARVYPIARLVNEDGTTGEPFLLRSLPSNGALPEYMEGVVDPNNPPEIGTRLLQWYQDNDLISWWGQSSWDVPSRSVEGQSLIESFIYRATDGGQVLMLRDWGHSNNPVHNNRIYVSFRSGQSGGWAYPYPSDIPDSPSRAQAITLENGTVLLIGNQNVNQFDLARYLVRDPITVAISDNGYSFDRVYALRTNAPTAYRFSGIGGRNRGYAYPSSIVVGGWLYTMYSIGKEDMSITRVRLSAMGL